MTFSLRYSRLASQDLAASLSSVPDTDMQNLRLLLRTPKRTGSLLPPCPTLPPQCPALSTPPLPPLLLYRGFVFHQLPEHVTWHAVGLQQIFEE